MEILGAFLIGIVGGMVGAISTGGGLITIPGVIFLGLSPIQAVATTRLSAVTGGLSSLYEYHKGKTIIWHYMLYFVSLSAVAGIIGPKLLLQINEELIAKVIGVLLLTTLPLFMLKQDFGIINQVKRRNHKILGLVALFVVMIYGTMFGAGGGVLLIYALIYFFGMNVTEANATGTVMWIAGMTIALITYIASGVVVFSVGIPLLLGAIIGGYLGARLALKNGVVWVKGVLAVLIVISSIKLTFF